jgi:hypothetical protein
MQASLGQSTNATTMSASDASVAFIFAMTTLSGRSAFGFDFHQTFGGVCACSRSMAYVTCLTSEPEVSDNNHLIGWPVG